ncbi:MAG: energy-coupling factor transporter transmembrane component T [Eubacterium sp.]|nr:energy-coupling factor transporter transmembrane component T [Eubacterium sp.]
MSESVWRRRHALTVFMYYLVGFSGLIVVSHPVFLLCVFGILLLVEMMETGVKETLIGLYKNLILALVILLFNLLINHRGPTLLFAIGDTRFTMESLLFGCRIALMILIALRFFMQFSRAMTEDKIMGLMAKRLPGLALLFSMVLRLVPQVKTDAAQLKKLHGRGPKVWMKLLSMTMEDGIVRSISMNERGYKSAGKRSSLYKKGLTIYDAMLLFVTLGWVAFLIPAGVNGWLEARFFPTYFAENPNLLFVLIFSVYYTIPLWLKGKEVFSWQRSKRRITHIGTPMSPEKP